MRQHSLTRRLRCAEEQHEARMTQRCPAACEMCGAPAHRASRGTGFARATCKCSGQSLVAWQNTVVYYVVLVAGNGHGQAAFAHTCSHVPCVRRMHMPYIDIINNISADVLFCRNVGQAAAARATDTQGQVRRAGGEAHRGVRTDQCVTRARPAHRTGRRSTRPS